MPKSSFDFVTESRQTFSRTGSSHSGPQLNVPRIIGPQNEISAERLFLATRSTLSPAGALKFRNDSLVANPRTERENHDEKDACPTAADAEWLATAPLD